MTMKNMERMSIRFQEKLLYFITQKAQTVACANKDVGQIVAGCKESIQKLRDEILAIKGKDGEGKVKGK